MAPAPIENMLLTCRLLESACVTGSGLPQPHAVVTLSEAARPDRATPEGRERIAAELTRHMDDVNRKLDPHEALELIAIAHDTWQIDNGFLTPTMKIKRGVIEAAYNPHAERWYERGEKIVWETGATT